MKFTIQQAVLNKALQTCSKATGTFLPASECFRFNINKQLQITCCNNEFSLSTALEAKAEGKCDILIWADKLKAWVASLPDQPVVFDLKGNTITITAGKATCSMPIKPGENMPSIKHETIGQFSLPYPDLTEALFKTAYARKVENGLGDLRCGLSVEFEKDAVCFFATNGDRMAAQYIDQKIESDNILLPYNFVNLLNSLLLTGDASFSTSKNSLQVVCDGYTITGVLLGAKYFDWRPSIQKYDNYIELSKNELISAIKRLLVLSDKFTQKVIFDMSPLGVSVTASDINFSQNACEDLTANYCGSQVKIGFNGMYLTDIVSRIDTETVYFYFGSNMQPGFFKSELHTKDFAAVGAMDI